jgi:hypothetical protein
MKRRWFDVWSALVITLALLGGDLLHAQFAYVVDANDRSVSGYTINPSISINPSERKTQLTLDMDREFDSEPMWKARVGGGKLVLQNPYGTLDQLDRTGNPGARYIWMVISFYQRLALALKNRQINEDLVPELFGDNFIWWYRHCFEKQLEPTDWESWQRMEYLNNWLAKKAKPEGLRSWEIRAEKYLIKDE